VVAQIHITTEKCKASNHPDKETALNPLSSAYLKTNIRVIIKKHLSIRMVLPECIAAFLILKFYF